MVSMPQRLMRPMSLMRSRRRVTLRSPTLRVLALAGFGVLGREPEPGLLPAWEQQPLRKP